MKTVIYSLSAIILISISSCGNMEDTGAPKITTEQTSDWYITIRTIDSCEYIFYDGAQESGICHKGNCSYCAARSRNRDTFVP